MTTQTSADLELRSINVEIGAAEQRHDVGYLSGVLHDELIFRRADGKIVTKEDYLRAVPTREYATLESDVAELHVTAGTALATVLVRAEGRANGTEFRGTYRNLRVFVSEGDRWLCKVWVNARAGMEIGGVHHVSLPVGDIDRSRRFYREVLGLRELERPPFKFDGAWFAAGDDQLHLIVAEEQTFREGKGVDSRDVHFAVRVRSVEEAYESLVALGYDKDADELEPMAMKVSPRPTAGFPQLYVLDPDRNVVEINAAKLDDPDWEP
jgi:catechol 2,3-dioxygenase-like lactoylglutathione lyase family enzyme